MASYHVYEQNYQQQGQTHQGLSLQERHRSQSDSNLLATAESNGSTSGTGEGSQFTSSGGPFVRMGSVGDLSPGKSTNKKKGFLYRLVRPWKWKKKKRSGVIGKDNGM